MTRANARELAVHLIYSQSFTGDEPDEDLYIEYIKNQIGELLTNYGKIHALFWDIPPKRREPISHPQLPRNIPHLRHIS